MKNTLRGKDYFMMDIRVEANQVIRLPLRGDFRIDWGDYYSVGGVFAYGLVGIDTLRGVKRSCEHVYRKAGDYTIRVGPTAQWGQDTPDEPRLTFSDLDVSSKIIEVTQWGTGLWTDMTDMFANCVNMTMSAKDAPDLSECTSLKGMFSHCYAFNGAIGHWDVSNITDMSSMFLYAYYFNQPLEEWDVSNVTNMNSMFAFDHDYNQPLEEWGVSNVTDMRMMFFDARAFNQPLNEWDAGLADKSSMFDFAGSFKQSLERWGVSNPENL